MCVLSKCDPWAKASFLSDAVWPGRLIGLYSFPTSFSVWAGLQMKEVVWGGPSSCITSRERSHSCRFIIVSVLLYCKPNFRKKQEWAQLSSCWSGPHLVVTPPDFAMKMPHFQKPHKYMICAGNTLCLISFLLSWFEKEERFCKTSCLYWTIVSLQTRSSTL